MAFKSQTNPIKGTITPVPSMPRHVVIYRVECSPFYWTRCFVNRRYRVRSTETSNKKLAYEFAKNNFMDALRDDEPSHIQSPKTFSAVAMSLLNLEKAASKKSLYAIDKGRLNSTILPFFKDKLIADITHRDLVGFLEQLNKTKIKAKKKPYLETDQALSPASKKHNLSLVHKIFKHAVEMGVTNSIPLFPKIKEKLQTTQKRDYLTMGEYIQLQKCINKMIKDGISYKGTPVTLEHKLLVNFMINAFIRPSDLKVIQHKHVIKRRDQTSKVEWLTLAHPATKTTAQDVQTMPNAAVTYKELVDFRKTQVDNQYLGPDDYLFLPQYTNRSTAMEKLGKIFALIIKTSGLEEKRDKNLTLYSLRHTAIMYRLINSDIDSLALAKNSRTSQAVIERFYGAHLTTEQVRKKLHSFRQRDSEAETEISVKPNKQSTLPPSKTRLNQSKSS